MTRNDISGVLNGISDAWIEEAALYAPEKKRRAFPGKWLRAGLAAVLALSLLAGGIGIFSPNGGGVTAYAYGVYGSPVCELTEGGVILSTGTISDSGEMEGHPLLFVLAGENIESVRFSCKNARLSFMDWTEKRDEYGLVQNFTVPYGADAEEYGSLVIDWTPSGAIYALTEGDAGEIADLPEELRSDLIVMEISFTDGSAATKSITVELREDGSFIASFEDYTITDEDTFVFRPDAQPIGYLPDGGTSGELISDERDADGTEVSERDGEEEALSAAREEALAYYAGTVLKVETMTLLEQSENEVLFSVLVSKGGILQEPERTITLHQQDGAWTVVNEGY